MMRGRRWLLGLGGWGIAALGVVACSGNSSTSRCDPSVDMCDGTTTDATTTSTSGSGGSGGASTTTSTTSGMGGSTTSGTGGKAGSGGSGGGMIDAGRTITKKVVVYLPTWSGSLRNWSTDIPWNQVSQVNIAFAYPSGSTLTLNPTSPGAGQDLYLDMFVSAAHSTGAKVLVSLGGAGTGSSQVAAQYAPGTVDAFVTNIAAYLDAHNLDGIDVDVEGNTAVNNNYGPFVDKLVAKVRPKSKIVTAALAQWFGNNISNATYALYDSVNVMAYDHCDSPGTPCSTYDSAVSELNYFKGKGVTADKLLLGVPFYCHCWGATGCIGQTAACTGQGCQVAYAQVNVKFPGGMDDISSMGVQYSCNGPATIQRKAMLAKGYAGMMAWEITQDAGGNNSLLKVMADNL
jgi:GH18 family chitinase